jgi:uncharacterized protein (DUF4415 family)
MARHSRTDTDIPELTKADFAKMRPARAVMPEFVEAARRGRPKLAHPKSMMSFRIDADLMARVKKDPELRKRAIKAFERTVRKGG